MEDRLSSGKNHMRMDVILQCVWSRAGFVQSIGRIEENFRARPKVQLLQIETHGENDNGIDLGGQRT